VLFGNDNSAGNQNQNKSIYALFHKIIQPPYLSNPKKIEFVKFISKKSVTDLEYSLEPLPTKRQSHL